jgi:hypothetical protein
MTHPKRFEEPVASSLALIFARVLKRLLPPEDWGRQSLGEDRLEDRK